MYEHARFETKVLNNRINFHLVAKYILKTIGTKTKKRGGGEGRENDSNPTKLKPFLYFHLSSSPPPPPPPFTHEKSWEERAQRNICIIIWIAGEKKQHKSAYGNLKLFLKLDD